MPVSVLPRTRHRSGLLRLLVVAAAGVILLAACSDGDDSSVETGATTPETTEAPATLDDVDVTVIAEDIDFPTTTFTATAGEITIGYVNEGRIRHTLLIEGVDDFTKLEVATNGDTDTGSVELAPGEYTLFCDVPGHRGAGMEGTLTVG